jgi:lipopolysaccharide export system protein LptA
MRPITIVKRAAAAALLASPLLIGGAQAQIQGDAPIDVSADEFESLDAQGLAIYRGAVEAVQGQTRLRCSELRVQFAPRRGGAPSAPGVGGGTGELQRMTCTGPVYYVTPTQTARGDNAVYEAGPEIITVTGNVVITQGENVATADRAVINTRTNDARLESNNRGSGSRRVRTVLYPESGPRPAGAAAPAAPSAPAAGAAAAPAAAGAAAAGTPVR